MKIYLQWSVTVAIVMPLRGCYPTIYLHLNEDRDMHLGIRNRATGRGSGGNLYSIVPGKPEESIMLYRMISKDPGVMMPESGRSLTHQEAIVMLRDWIMQMDKR